MNSGMFHVRLLLLILIYPSLTYAQVSDTASVFKNPLLNTGPDPWMMKISRPPKGLPYFGEPSDINLPIKTIRRIEK
ncbi:hypothetical protein DVR12_21260 [Chitinophaga silvatica]|uniref:Uncharacterized protein n=1 Tax=Chitinophaga silvatica TaxID=2282649 RepID=A0A3E1Y4L4_9BACT|nr:hypothetical protein [Chitinophaga silvatica]RFS19635.1 hypothetical protein DVR12_21260 [Chitinophaga silvatica]